MDGRPSLLDDYKPYLHQRWNQGCTNVRRLHAELRDRGYRGGYGTIRDYVQPFRDLGAAPPAVPARRKPVKPGRCSAELPRIAAWA
jgi:transposase